MKKRNEKKIQSFGKRRLSLPPLAASGFEIIIILFDISFARRWAFYSIFVRHGINAHSNSSDSVNESMFNCFKWFQKNAPIDAKSRRRRSRIELNSAPAIEKLSCARLMHVYRRISVSQACVFARRVPIPFSHYNLCRVGIIVSALHLRDRM